MRPKQLLLIGALCLLAPTGAKAADCSEDTAVQAMERAVKADSKNPNNNFNLATAYYNKQCYDQAIGAFENTLKLVKGDSQQEKDMRFDVTSTLGGLYFQGRQDPGTAVKYFKQALALKPSDGYSLNGISMALVKDGKTDEAMDYLKKALLADRGNVEAHYRMAVLLNQKLEAAKEPADKLRNEVIAAFDKTADLAEGKKGTEEIRVASYTRLGELYRDTKQSAKAVEVLNKAIKLAPNDFNSHFILGQMYYNEKNFAAMIDEYKKAVEIDPNQKLSRFNLGVAYINQEQYAEAYDQFKAITDIDKNDSESLVLMGQTLERAVDQLLTSATSKYTAEDLGGAKADFEKVLTLDPKNKTASEYLGKVTKAVDKAFAEQMDKAKKFLKAKKKEDAAEALERALAMKPDDEEAKKLRSETKADIGKLVKRYLAQGDRAYDAENYESAEKLWKQAQGFRQGKESATKKLAKLTKKTSGALASALKEAKNALKKKDLAKARTAFRKAKAVAPSNAEATNGLNQVNNQIADKVAKAITKAKKALDDDKKSVAKNALDEALKLDPNSSEAKELYAKASGGNENKAVKNQEKIKQLYYQGVDLYVNNKIKEAISVWEELLTLDKDNVDAQKNIARAKAKLKALASL